MASLVLEILHTFDKYNVRAIDAAGYVIQFHLYDKDISYNYIPCEQLCFL